MQRTINKDSDEFLKEIRNCGQKLWTKPNTIRSGGEKKTFFGSHGRQHGESKKVK